MLEVVVPPVLSFEPVRPTIFQKRLGGMIAMIGELAGSSGVEEI